MQKVIIQLSPFSCPSCMQKVENAAQGQDGVEPDSVKVLFNSSKVLMSFDSRVTTLATIEKMFEDLGYPVITSKAKATTSLKNLTPINY